MLSSNVAVWEVIPGGTCCHGKKPIRVQAIKELTSILVMLKVNQIEIEITHNKTYFVLSRHFR